MYGLKESACKWNKRLDKFLKKCGFVQSDSDPNLCILKKGGRFLYLLVYVDDLLLASDSQHLIEVVKNLLKSEFEMSDLGEPTCFLGLEVKRDRGAGSLTILQRKYVTDCLVKFNMDKANESPTPIATGVRLIKEENPAELKKAANLPYKQTVGSLIFLACLTRCDISYAVHLVSQFMSCYSDEHWQQVKRILRYLKGTASYCITYTKPINFT